MSEKIVELPTPYAPQAEVTDLLRGLLERAEAGEFSSIAVAAVTRDGRSMTDWTVAPVLTSLRGAVGRLNWRICSSEAE